MAGATIWFTGLSGAGKTTLAHLVHDELARRGEPVELLDGDIVRTIAAYHAGAGSLMRYGGNVPPYTNTRKYLRMVLDRYYVEVEQEKKRLAQR